MKKFLLATGLFFLVFQQGFAQCVPTCSNYVCVPITYSLWPTGGNNAIPLFSPNTDDGCTSPLGIGFTFNYYCSNYSNVLIYSNGMIQMDIGVPSTFPLGYDAAQLFGTSTGVPNALVAFRMDDLDPTVGGTITYTTVGTSPNQQFVVTYSNVPLFGNASSLHSGQIVLHETTNYIDIITISSPATSNAATQGIENELGTMGVGVPGRNQAAANANNWGTANAYRFIPVAPAPPGAISGTNSICEALSTTYSVTAVGGATAYSWSLPGGWTGTSTLSSITATAGISGNFSVSASYTCGTSAPSLYSVTVIPAPVVAITSATPGIFCSGVTATFQTSGAISYTLQPGNITGTPPFFATPLVTTQFSLTGTNAAGCESKNVALSNITVKETPTVTVNSGAICIGNSFQMTASGANSYVYSSNFSAVTPNTVGTHTYSVVGTSTNGCQSLPAISTVTVNALPTISVGVSKPSICAKQVVTVTASGATTYTWSNITGTVVNNAALTVTPNLTTVYSVTATDANGCVNSGSVNVNVNKCIGIDENQSVLNLRVYPNPAHGAVHIWAESALDYTLLDATGKIVLQGVVNAGQNSIDIKNMAGGLYFLKINNGSKFETRQIVIQ